MLTEEGKPFGVTANAGTKGANVYGDPGGRITRDALQKPDLSRKHMTDAMENLAQGSNINRNKAYNAIMQGAGGAAAITVPGGNTTLIVLGVGVVAIALYFYAR